MIEFIEGEDYCRYNGIVLTPEYSTFLMGIDYSDYIEFKNHIIITGYINEERFIIINTDETIDAIMIYLDFLSYVETTHYYENALDERHGFSKEKFKTLIHVDDDFFKDIKSLYLLQDFPNINVPLIKQINKEIDDYYKLRFNNL